MVAHFALVLLTSARLAQPCHFKVPADMPDAPHRWLGACPAGDADGLGTLVVALASGDSLLFFGRMNYGLPIQGIIVNTNAKAAGGLRVIPRFDKTLHLDPETPVEMLQSPDTYNTAASGARVAEKHYAALGNKSSAAFYRAQAKMLAQGPPE